MRKSKKLRGSSGQALIETALVMPLILLLALNVVNFGFFFVAAVNLAATPRSGVEYSILGFQTPSSLTLPPAPNGATITITSVSYVSQQDLNGALANPTGATIQVCSPTNGINANGINTTTKCVSCTGTACGAAAAGSPAPAPDPEAPTFTLNRVDVDYTFNPPIPGTPFGLALLPMPGCKQKNGTVSCDFHRQVSMRAIN